MLAPVITALHSSHLTNTAFITVTLTMAVCQRTRADGEEKRKKKKGRGRDKKNTDNALCSGHYYNAGRRTATAISESNRRIDRRPLWWRKVNDGEETD